jgi:uncharacterized damage-inducible protein DinB
MRISMVPMWLLAAPVLLAQGGPPAKQAPSIRQEILGTFNQASNRALTLAKAIPQEKLAWRPMDGVRSFGEVFVHMAGGTLLFCSYAGVKIPEGPAHDLAAVYMKRGFELPELFATEAAIKDKAKIVEVMEQAFTQMREMLRSLPDADLDKQVEFFGRPMTLRALLNQGNEHLGEHLGQAIAYARVNHIVPPWSEPQKKK